MIKREPCENHGLTCNCKRAFNAFEARYLPDDFVKTFTIKVLMKARLLMQSSHIDYPSFINSCTAFKKTNYATG